MTAEEDGDDILIKLRGLQIHVEQLAAELKDQISDERRAEILAELRDWHATLSDVLEEFGQKKRSGCGFDQSGETTSE